MDSGHLKKEGEAEAEQSFSSLAACPGCDLLAVVPRMTTGRYLECTRCGSAIAKTIPDSVNRVFCLSLAGLLLYVPAILLPLLTLSSLGFKERGNVLETAVHLFESHYYFVSLMVVVTAVLVPFFKLLLPFGISLCIKLNRRYRFWNRASSFSNILTSGA